jgi:hypothetical protein
MEGGHWTKDVKIYRDITSWPAHYDAIRWWLLYWWRRLHDIRKTPATFVVLMAIIK